MAPPGYEKQTIDHINNTEKSFNQRCRSGFKSREASLIFYRDKDI